MTELHNILIKDDGNRITLIFSKTVSDIRRMRKLSHREDFGATPVKKGFVTLEDF